MTDKDVRDMRVVPVLNSVEENDAPECMEENDAQSERGACNEEQI